VDGYFTIGVQFVGLCHYIARVVALGSVRTMEQGVSREEGADRSGRVRAFASARRVVDVSVLDPTYEEDLYGGTEPDYIESTTTGGIKAAGSFVATPLELFGLAEGLKGRPVVYLPKVLKGSPDTLTFNRRDQIIYGSMVDDIRIEIIVGDELTDQLNRVPLFSIVEEK